jgi:serine/threonine protein kinase/dipeptidyl aminopeptidase/acylaminoacyl peptidase
MPFAEGFRLGPYEIVAPIGSGGMGEVYRGRDTRLNRDVALKVLPEAFARDAERMARFRREAQVLASLNHPNIAAIYGFEDSGATHALVMELVEGPTLAERIKQGAIAMDEALPISKQIAEGIEYAHERSIVHRDLKPANIKITNNDAVKILDFGLAKALEGDAAAVDISSSPTITRMATQAGIILGTAAYMSPEQAKGKAVDRRTDIWAFGCVLYEMLTGKMAFSGETVTDTLAAVIRAEPEWSALPANTPVAIRNLLQRCLKKDPRQRLQSIGDARIALEEILSGAGVQSESSTASSSANTLLHASTSSRKARSFTALPWAIAGILAIALVAMLALLFFRPAVQPAQRVVAYLMPPGDVPFDTTGDRGAPPVISPDGTNLVFGAGGQFWLRQLDQDSARELESTDGASFPFWSPDSGSIGFFQSGKLRTMDLQGGGVVTICDAPNARGGSWSSAGFILFAPTITSAIMKVAAGGGTPVPVTTLKPGVETTHRWPQVLPDGKKFIYFATSHTSGGAGNEAGMFAASIDGGQPVRLLNVPNAAVFASGNLLFLRGTTLMAQAFDPRRLRLDGEPRPVASNVAYDLGVWRGTFTVSDNGVLVYSGGDPGAHRLLWFSNSGQPGNSPDSGRYKFTALSPKGTRIAEVMDPQGDLWVLDLNGGGRVRLASDRGSNPVWSPDERQIAYGHFDNSGIARIMVRPTDGTGSEKPVAPEPAWQIPTDWSPDGKYILYNRGDPGTSHIWALAASGGEPFPVVQTEAWDRGGHFSPNGKWIVFTSRETGTDQVYITPFPGPGPKWQASTQGGGGARWGPDGKWICFWNGAHNMLFKVSVSLSGSRPQFGAENAMVKGAVYEGLSYDADYSLSRDGRVLVNTVGEQSARLTLVTNWMAGLKP